MPKERNTGEATNCAAWFDEIPGLEKEKKTPLGQFEKIK